jgi:hypothetical protein
MELYIQIRDGQPFEHPILGDNFREAFPHIDVNNLPPEFARFERLPDPENATTFQVGEVRYEWVGDVVKDVWTVREMTQEEKTQKLETLTEAALSRYELLKTGSQEQLDLATTDEHRQAWTDYLAQLSAWVLIDPENPKFPAPPRITQDGDVLQVTAPGAEPDVIG